MAAAACWAITSHDEPPTFVESTQLGRSPRYSLTSTGASRDPCAPTPSMSFLANPASPIALRADWAISAVAVLSGTRPQSDSPTPTIATRFAAIRHGYHTDNVVHEKVESSFSLG